MVYGNLSRKKNIRTRYNLATYATGELTVQTIVPLR